MDSTKSSIIYSVVLELNIKPVLVRQFIMTPERILDYFPSPLDGGVLDPGRAIYCRGKSGVSLLQIDEVNSKDSHVVVKVSTAMKLKPPLTIERIEAAAFFTMIEDWELEETESGTRLTKTWRDIVKKRLRLLPIKAIVRSSVKSESEKLVAGWNKAGLISSFGSE